MKNTSKTQSVITMFMVLAVVFLAVGFAVLIYQKFANQLHYGGKIGGPKGYPLVGNAFRFINKSPPGKKWEHVRSSLRDRVDNREDA